MESNNHKQQNLDLFNDRDPNNEARIHLVFDQSDKQIYLVKSELTPVSQDLLDEIIQAVTDSAGAGDKQTTETRGDISKENSTDTRGDDHDPKDEVKLALEKARQNLGNARFEWMKEEAINGFLEMRKDIVARIQCDGVPHFGITKGIEAFLPRNLKNSQTIAYSFVPEALDRKFGPGMTAIVPRLKADGDGETKWVVLKGKENNSEGSHGGGTFGPVDRGGSSRRSRQLDEGLDQ